mmetsp:Transcript_6789/g.16551  ORF Transcript_6789/g.16551 Transcript_6789/m.16551 type:complete len:398 (+) Transcript_6789:117-1310(+)
MGLLDNIFNDDKKKPPSNNNNNNNNNPLANIRKNIEKIGKPKMKGPGYSLGGSKPGQVFEIVLPNHGPLGIRVEQRSNNSASAIVNMVVQGSQADLAGLKRGDVLCFAGSNGQNEMPYSMFLEMAKSKQRPLHLEARRFDARTAAATSGGSADAEARRRAVIAAADAREKKHKSQTKTIKHVTKSTLLKQQQLQEHAIDPQSEASRKAAQAAKQGEADLAAELGYNPYEAVKKTAGQARAATTTTQHGAIAAQGGGTASIPTVAPPKNPTTAFEDPRFPYAEFEEALATIASSDKQAAAKSGLKISKKLVANATTKGQQPGEAGEKFRRVRLANPKIKAAIVDVPGNLPLMLSVGFELHPDDANPDESLLVFPPAFQGPTWIAAALKAMEETEKDLA